LRDRAAAAEQDDRLYHGALRHGADLFSPGPEARQAHDPEDGGGAHESSQR